MWSIKFLSGPERGKEYLLPKGLIVLGRDQNCQIPILSPGVSKNHAQLIVSERGELVIEDMNSSNGVFLNGKQIQEESLREGDRIGLCNVIFEIQKKDKKEALSRIPQEKYMMSHQPDSFSQPTAGAPAPQDAGEEMNRFFKTFYKLLEDYLHKVILPGIYKLAEWTDFRLVVAGFILAFVVSVTVLSFIPLNHILKSSIEQESKNHAESLANTLVKLNQEAFAGDQSPLPTALNVSFALRRRGVKQALIVNAVNGRILAPSEKAERFPKEPFIHHARKLDRSSVEKLSQSTVGAAVPITLHNVQTGETAPVAYAVILYDMGASTLAIGSGQFWGLLFTNLFIAAVLGLLLFFFLIHLIHFPIRNINHQLNESLKEESDSSVSTTYQSEVLHDLCGSINSALNQIALNQSAQNEGGPLEFIGQHRHNEMTNVVEVIGFPALSINLTDNTVAWLNSSFKEQIGLEEILNQSLDDIPDRDFKDNLKGLMEQAHINPEDISFGQIALKGMELETTCQFIKGTDKPAYAIITFIPAREEAA